MKKIILVTLVTIIACMSFTACSKSDSSVDDAYYTYVAQDITEDTITLKGFNGAGTEENFDIDVEEWDMTQFEAGSYIVIYVNEKDEILEIKDFDESDMRKEVLDAIKKDNNIEE